MKAFPRKDAVEIDEKGRQLPQLGMDLRDYFAAKALQGLLACETNYDYDEETLKRNDYSEYCKIFAESAYNMADAMMEARK